MTALVPVIAIPLLRIPNMLLLARIAASLALICEWPETYVKAPRPKNVALPNNHVSTEVDTVCSRVQYRLRDMECNLQIPLCHS